jgi:predicted Zn-dependent protease
MQDYKLSTTIKRIALSLVLASPFVPHGPAHMACADAISPNITSGGRVYSEEKPNKAFFGTGMSGRLSEASYLRFMGEQALDDGDVPAALQKLSKAVQLDAGDPTGHMLFARAMTMKINRSLRKGEDVDRELLDDCIAEWKLIARHDADTSEQAEAKAQCRRLTKVAKLLNAQIEGKVAVKKRTFFGSLARKDDVKPTAREKVRLADKDRSDSDDEKSEDL